jgi:hypothetical protein
MQRLFLWVAGPIALSLAGPALAQNDTAAALAQLDASLPGELINDPTSLDWATQGENLRVSSVTGGDTPGGGAAARYDVRRAGANPWSVQVYVPLTAGIARGEVATVGFWARTPTPPEGASGGQVSVRFQENADPWPGFGDTALAIGPDWQWHEVSATASTDVSARNGVVVFQLGAARQQVEIGQTIVIKGADRIRAEGPGPQIPLPPQLEGKGALISQPHSRDWVFGGPEASRAARDEPAIYLGRAVQFISPGASETPWDIQASVPLTGEVKAGDTLLIAVAAKTVSAAAEDGRALVGIRVQQNAAPYEGFAENTFKVGPNWQLVQIRTTATMDLPAGGGMVALHFAGAEQAVDVGPVYVLKEAPAP